MDHIWNLVVFSWAVLLCKADEVRWVLLEVSEEGVVIADEGIRTGEPSQNKILETEAHFSLYHNEEGGNGLHFPDPRYMHHEHLDETGKDWNGTVVRHEKGFVDVRLPSSVDMFHVHHGGKKSSHSLKRRGTLLQSTTTRNPEVVEFQTVANVNDTVNIVFLSGCYASSSRDKFISDVKRSVRFLTGITTSEGSILVHGTPLSSQPFNRYFTHFNIFAVFEASPQDGANHPLADGSNPNPKPNRLQCSYGTTIKRMLSCNFAQTRSLASYAPASDVILTLVNDDEYGGAGGSGQAAIYTGNGFEKVLIHEIGHAAGDLSDEYDYGFEEQAALHLKNCDKNKNSPTWSYWQQKWAAQGKPTTPLSTCSYKNYFRPTDDCLMKSSGKPKLCDVCREALLKTAILDKKIDLSVPRCPLVNEVLIVKNTTIGYLHVNPSIQDKYQYEHPNQLWGPPFKIVWGCKMAPFGVPCPSVIPYVNGTDMTVGDCSGGGMEGVDLCGWGNTIGDYELQVTVVDTVTGGWTGQTSQSATTFKFKVVDDQGYAASNCNKYDCNTRYGKGTGAACNVGPNMTACLSANCYWRRSDKTCTNFFSGAPGSGDSGYKICTLCEGSQDKCDITFKAHPQSAESFTDGKTTDIDPVNFDSIKDQLGASIYIIMISAGLFGLTMLFALYKTCSKTFGYDEKEEKYTSCNQALRIVIMILFTIMVWTAVGVVGFGVYLFLQTEMEIWGSAIVILVIVCGAGIFSVSFFVFGAVAGREKCKLGASGVVLTIGTILIVVLSIIIHAMANNASDGADRPQNATAEWEAIDIDEIGVNIKWMEHLRDLWKTGSRSSPKIICKFQEEMKCSGFQKSCYNIGSNSSYCPADCKIGNTYVNPCMNVLQRKLAKNFKTASAVTVAVSATLGCGAILVWWLFGSLFCCANKSANEYSAYNNPAKPPPPNFARPQQGNHHRPPPPHGQSIEMGTI